MARKLILPLPDPKVYTDPRMAQDQREFRRALEEQLSNITGSSSNPSASDEINAVEAYLWNAGDPLVAGDSDWVFVPFSFTITLAEIVADIAGSLTVDVYASSYSAWSGFTLISGAAPITLAGVAKAHPPLTGWTKTFSGGTYLRFTVSGTPVTIRKATISLELTLPNSVLVSDTGVMVSGAAGGVLSGTYPNPGFAEDMATQAELNIETAARVSGDAAGLLRSNHTGTQTASTISDFNSASRAQTEAELVAGANITITPGSSGATRTLTIAAAAGATALYTEWDHKVPDGSPHALTDEFSSNTLGGYTQVYGNGDSTTVVDIHTTKPGALYIFAPTINYHQHSVLKALPAGDFAIFTAVSVAAAGAEAVFAGLILSTASVAGSGTQAAQVIGRAQTSASTVFQVSGLVGWSGFGSAATGSSFTGSNATEYPVVVLRIRRVSTTVTRAYSVDGKTWLYEQAITNAAWTHFGCFLQNYSGQSAAATFDYLRYYSSGSTLDTGGSRTVYG